MEKVDEDTLSAKIGRHVELEIDVKENLAWYLMMQVVRFFMVPVKLFNEYFVKFKLSKTSRFYNLVNYPLSDYLFKKTIEAVVILGLFWIGLYAFEFEEYQFIVAMVLIALILFLPAFLKILFLTSVMIVELIVRIIKSIFFTVKSLVTERTY